MSETDTNEADLLRLRAIVSSITECIKSVDRDCRLLDMNPAGLKLIAADCLGQVEGQSVLYLVRPAYHEQFKEGVRRVFNGETVDQEFEIEGLDGTRRWMHQMAVPYRDPDGNGEVTEMIAVTRDVTSRVAAERAKSAFLANMSHEIRTPMNGVLGFLELAKTRDDGALHPEEIASIHASAKALVVLLNDILDISKLDADAVRIAPRPTDVADMSNQVAHLFSAQLKFTDVELSVETAADATGFYNVDSVRLRQILSNLVGNAIKFTEKGRIHIRLSCDGDGTLRFEVEDTGIGISEEDQARIFKRFSQADETTTRQYGGAGLGLSISQRLCTLMGGSMGVTSTPGRGSTFNFTFAAPKVEAIQPSAAVVERPVTSALRVLVVDDQRINLTVASALLNQLGHQTTTADDPHAAQKLAEEQGFDVIFMDIQMPVCDGIELTRRIRAGTGPNTQTPVIAFTASTMQEERDRYAREGLNGCLAKPVEMRNLTALLDELPALISGHHTRFIA